MSLTRGYTQSRRLSYVFLKLLVLELAFKLLRLCKLANSLVEVVLVDGFSVILNGK